MSTSAQSPGNRREAILQTAKRLFAERGYRETNLNDVAVRLGIRRQALYHYFGSKDDILFELVERAGQAVDIAARKSLESDLSPVDKLDEIVRSHVRQVLGDADVFRIQFEEVSKMQGERGDELRRSQRVYVRRVAEVIESGQREGSLVSIPPTTQALSIIGMCNWTIYWYDPSHGPGVEEVAAYISRLAIGGARQR